MTWAGSANITGYVIGLTGTHGTGKSTVSKGLKELGYPVDNTSLSRTAQIALGWDSLARVKDAPENIWLLQEAILSAMHDRDEKINQSKIVTIVDRTPADVASYALMWLLKLDYIGPENRDRYTDFHKRCRVMASRYARHIYFPIREEIPFEEEARRADKEDRDVHDRHIQNFLGSHFHTTKIENLSPTDRIAEVREVYEFENWYIKNLENESFY